MIRVRAVLTVLLLPAMAVTGEAYGQFPVKTDAGGVSLETFAYEMLIAEVAGQQGNASLSARAYVDLSKRTRDPRVAQRATEIALYARMNGLAIEAAQVWHDSDQSSVRALQALAGLLVSAERFDEALPYVRKLAAANPTEAFTQLDRSVARSQDKVAALNLVRKLADGFPALPEAHLGVAQAAQRAGERELALQEVRRALYLRSNWDAANKLEREILER